MSALLSGHCIQYLVDYQHLARQPLSPRLWSIGFADKHVKWGVAAPDASKAMQRGAAYQDSSASA